MGEGKRLRRSHKNDRNIDLLRKKPPPTRQKPRGRRGLFSFSALVFLLLAAITALYILEGLWIQPRYFTEQEQIGSNGGFRVVDANVVKKKDEDDTNNGALENIMAEIGVEESSLFHKNEYVDLEDTPHNENKKLANERSPTRSRPILIIHVGPPKTATTALQVYLSTHADVLERDNYMYYGKAMDYQRTLGQVVSCIANRASGSGANRKSAVCPKRLLEEEKERFRTFAQRGNNIIVSTEDLATLANTDQWFNRRRRGGPANHEGGRILKEILLSTTTDERPYQFDIHVVVGYRRYYDWLPSVFNQMYKYEHTIQNQVTKGMRGDNAGPVRSMQIGDGGVQPMPSFSSFVDAQHTYDKERDGDGVEGNATHDWENYAKKRDESHPPMVVATTDRAIQYFADLFGTDVTMHVWNLHKRESYEKNGKSEKRRGGDINNDALAYFVCDIIVNATHTCSDIGRWKEDDERRRPPQDEEEGFQEQQPPLSVAFNGSVANTTNGARGRVPGDVHQKIDNRKPQRRENESVSLSALNITRAALHMGLFQPSRKLRVQFVTARIQAYIGNDVSLLDDMEWHCLSAEQERYLYERTVDIERSVLSMTTMLRRRPTIARHRAHSRKKDEDEDEQELVLRSDFDLAKRNRRGQFCTPDVMKALQEDGRWENFFSSPPFRAVQSDRNTMENGWSPTKNIHQSDMTDE